MLIFYIYIVLVYIYLYNYILLNFYRKWCPRGTVKPQRCFGLGINKCPERTAQAPKYGLLWVFLGFFLLVGLFFSYRKRKTRIRNAKFNNLLQHMMESKEDRPEAVVINRKKYDIQFENLGLTLPNGVEIMRVSFIF